MTPFPTSIDAIDAAWLTHTLGAAGAIGDASVTDFDAESIGLGVGIMGLLHRLHLRYDRDGAGPATVVAKLGTATAATES